MCIYTAVQCTYIYIHTHVYTYRWRALLLAAKQLTLSVYVLIAQLLVARRSLCVSKSVCVERMPVKYTPNRRMLICTRNHMPINS